MSDPRVALTWEGPVALITIYRPEKLNALDLDMLASLDDACVEIEGNHAARAAVITGEGKAFSTGGDIKAWASLLPHEFGFDWVRVGNRVFNRMAELRVPLIAALSGHAGRARLPASTLIAPRRGFASLPTVCTFLRREEVASRGSTSASSRRIVRHNQLNDTRGFAEWLRAQRP